MGLLTTSGVFSRKIDLQKKTHKDVTFGTSHVLLWAMTNKKAQPSLTKLFSSWPAQNATIQYTSGSYDDAYR
jgi:hypothetical protein